MNITKFETMYLCYKFARKFQEQQAFFERLVAVISYFIKIQLDDFVTTKICVFVSSKILHYLYLHLSRAYELQFSSFLGFIFVN